MKKIPLSQGEYAFVDDEDFDIVKDIKWHLFNHPSGNKYARGHIKIEGKYHNVYMHRFIMKPEAKILIDHKDGNGLNNCRSNLRYCTRSQNNSNSLYVQAKCGLRGAWFNKVVKKWESHVTKDGKKYRLGYFNTKEEAHEAFVKASLKYHGEFSPYNR